MNNFANVFVILVVVASAAGDVSEKDVTFAVRTPQDPKNQNFVQPIDTSKINPSYPVIIITHGWTDAGNASWVQNLTDAYFEQGNYNVIAVNWHKPADKNYLTSAGNTEDVGNMVGDAIIKINKDKNIDYKDFHCIGHSLGAHVFGFAGERVLSSASTKLNWITGLDPAGPRFEVPKVSKSKRLSDDDADVVEIIHSDGGILGFHSSLGTIDFYPNGGRYIQPHCDKNEELFQRIKDLVGCSHHKSIEYYTYAVRKQGIAATQCKSWRSYKNGDCKDNQQAKFGTKTAPTEKGSYFVAIDK